MSIFASQFDHARQFTDAYAGGLDEPQWYPPPGAADPPAGWGEGWDTGWELGWEAGPAGEDAAGAWLERGDYTDAGVGGDGDFFYFIDGDSSLTVG